MAASFNMDGCPCSGPPATSPSSAKASRCWRSAWSSSPRAWA
jgi:hypothetical protein